MAKLDRDNAFYDYVAPVQTAAESDAAEKAKIAAMREANKPQKKKYIGKDGNYYDSPVEAQLGRDIGSSAGTKETAEERNARIAKDREDTQSGNNPDNPMPDEDPGEGMYWANYGGVWRKYKKVTNSSGNDSGNNDGNNSNGNGNSSTTTSNTSKSEISDATRDAFAALQDLFSSYGLESLAGEISDYMKQGLTAAEALIKLKTNPSGSYAKRFAGNFTRVKNGLNAISEAEYINLENSYANTLKAYGLGNMVSGNREDNYKKFAEYIAGDISAVEFKDRVDTVVTRVQNADPALRLHSSSSIQN